MEIIKPKYASLTSDCEYTLENLVNEYKAEGYKVIKRYSSPSVIETRLTIYFAQMIKELNCKVN